MTKRKTELPWRCPEHPDAQIRQSWDSTRYVMNGYPVGTGVKSNYRYECEECGKELASPKSADMKGAK